MIDMTNFLDETIRCLNSHAKTENDVLWVGRGYDHFSEAIGQEKYKSTWEDFKSKADFYYDDGYGLECIPTDLIIVGTDFWLERSVYDGAEWWAYKTMPTEPAMARKLDLSDAWQAAKEAVEMAEELDKMPEIDMDDFFNLEY